MNHNPIFTELCRKAFNNWRSGIKFQGLSQDAFAMVFSKILAEQSDSGTWISDGDKWEVVQTAVVLKAFATLGFRGSDQWSIQTKEGTIVRNIEKPLSFLRDQLSTQTMVGEDMWDTCQALLVMAAFNLKEVGRKQVREIFAKWKTRYEQEVNSKEPNQWCGPSYLASMIDVMLAYRSEPNADTTITQALRQLKELGTVDGGEAPYCYPAVIAGDQNINRWNTGLVLRTICAAAAQDDGWRDIASITAASQWLVDEFRDGKHWCAVKEKEPMFRSRCLEGIRSSIPFVSNDLASAIDSTCAEQNEKIEALLVEKWGKIKTYTAVAEYFSQVAVPVPAALLCELGSEVKESSDISDVANAHRRPRRTGGANSGKIFIVHGRDELPRLAVARFVENMGLEVVILEEQPDTGKSIIEKLEEYSDVDFAIILLTPDDIGGLASDQASVSRARQNVIFELGYFVARLGRDKVCLLKRDELEIPTDFSGVVPIKFDADGGWKSKLASSLEKAGIPGDLRKSH